MNLVSLIQCTVIIQCFYKVGSVSLPGLIELPIYAINNEYFTNLTLGTPPQVIQVKLDNILGVHDLQIALKRLEVDLGTQYEEKKSSTYALNKESKDKRTYWEKSVTETFHFNGVEYEGVPFKLIRTHYFAAGILGFNYRDDGKMGEFWQSLFKTLPSNIVTIALENDLQTGAITVGGYDSKRCNSDWHIMEEVFYNYLFNEEDTLFGPKIEDIRFGKTTIKSTKTNWYLDFRLDNLGIVWPATIYTEFLKELGSKDNRTVSCNATMNIDIRMGKTVLSLTPDEYLKKNADDSCILNGSKHEFANNEENGLVLPNVLLKRHCMFFDHENKKFGISTKTNSKGKKTLRYVK